MLRDPFLDLAIVRVTDPVFQKSAPRLECAGAPVGIPGASAIVAPAVHGTAASFPALPQIRHERCTDADQPGNSGGR